jgi:hypothetical protein
MRAFLTKVFIFALLQLFIFGFIVLFNSPNASSYMRGYKMKQELLKEAPGARIIFVGASNLAFGLNSKIIKEATGLNPINMGLHAGIGRKLILNDAIPATIKPNDLIVLCLEYNNFAAMPAGEALWQLLRVDPSVAFDLSSSDVVDLSESAFSYLGGQLRNSIKNLLRGRRGQAFNPIYTTDGFNQFGDLTAHWNLGHREGPRNITPLVLEGKNFDRAFNDVSAFVEKCREKGARVVFSFPPLRKDQYLKNKESIDALTLLLSENLNMEAIGSAEAMAFPEEYFFDTAYHLNYSGVEKRSELLSNAMSDYLEGEVAANNTL